MRCAVISSCEALRLSFLTEPEQLELAAAEDDAHHAAATLAGLEPWAEHEAEPACDWCGRSSPLSGLADESLGGPPNFACHDTEDCQKARDLRLEKWMTSQTPWWRIDWQKYLASLRAEQEIRARARYGGGIYQLTDPLELAALAEVRELVEGKAVPLAESIVDMRELVALAVSQQPLTWPAAYDQPGPAPFARLCGDSGCDHTTMRCADARTWTLGHHRQFRGVTDAGAALGRKAVLARSGLPGLLTINRA
jgi:hypothetical protein